MALSIPSSLDWLGSDGNWSTFAIQLGDPPQTLKILPSTSSSGLWVVDESGCDGSPLSNCPSLRGNLFTPNKSHTFQNITSGGTSIYQLPYSDFQLGLGYNGNAIVGLENATLGALGSGAPQLSAQFIAAYVSQPPFLGLLGLSNYSSHVDSSTDAYDTLIQTLRKQGQIPSSYLAYNAGAIYRKLAGSLTLGGYDAIRGNENKVLEVPLGADSSRDIIVTILDIILRDQSGTTLDGGSATVSSSAVIDSLVPEIWLPAATCLLFESAFGLQWNDTAGYYLVNDTQHERLLQQNTSVTFTLGANASSTSTIDIVLPYAAFDMQLSWPLANITDDSSKRYFPLKRAVNPSEYTLGRTFLQEA